MKIWLTKSSQVSIRDQLVMQVRVGIASGELNPGDRLPSTREIARRYKVHPNTVSSAYKELAEAGFVTNRKGSGVFVADPNNHQEFSLDQFVQRMIREADARGHSLSDVLDRMAELSIARPEPERLALFEPNLELRKILAAEIQEYMGIEPEPVELEQLGSTSPRKLVALFDEETKLSSILSAGEACLYLKANSVSATMGRQRRPEQDELFAIVSAWEDFRNLARLFLIAARIDPAAIIVCSVEDHGWQRRVRPATRIICDSLAAQKLAGDDRVNRFPVIADASLAELKSFWQNSSTVQDLS